MIRRIIKITFNKLGYAISNKSELNFILDRYLNSSEEDFRRIYEKCKDYTITSIERMYALYTAAKYVVRHQIAGDIVQCGVWKGGSAMLISMVLTEMNARDKKIYLYDTYSGMPEPTEKDVNFSKMRAKEKWRLLQRNTINEWCYAPLEEVKQNLFSTGYPEEKFVFIKGKVEETIPSIVPDRICLLHLDTDWYESTYHELVHLFPRLSTYGVILIDDYGAWAGAKEATDKYFEDTGKRILLSKVDYTGIIGVKV